MPNTRTNFDPFHAIANPIRRAVLDRVRDGAATVAEIVSALQSNGLAVSRNTVSQHLRVLCQARLLARPGVGDDGRWAYRLTPAPLLEVVRWTAAYAAASARDAGATTPVDAETPRAGSAATPAGGSLARRPTPPR